MSLNHGLLGLCIAAYAAGACGSNDDSAALGAAQGGYGTPSGGARAAGGTSSNGAGGRGPGPLGGAYGAFGGASVSSGGVSAPSAGAPAIPERADVVLYHQSDVSDATTNRIVMRLFLENRSADVLPLAQVKVRYWMTSEVPEPYLHSYYAGTSVRGQLLSYVDAGPASHIEVRFDGGAIARGDDLNLSEVGVQIDGGTFVQTNDYSFDPGDTERRANRKITVYLAGTLIWGCEPSGACPGSVPGMGGAGGAGGVGGEGGAPNGADDGGAGGASAWTSGGEGGFGAGGEGFRPR